MTRRSPAIEDEVSALAALDLAALRAAWAEQGGPVPKLRSVDLLRLMLAWRIQAKALGALDAPTRKALVRRKAGAVEGQSHGHGAVFRRVWQGRMIEAIVETDGFRFDGRLYRSLSAVAEAATGTRWNGPRFFGLRGTATMRGTNHEARP